jgi:hypothetical protein
MPIGSIETVLCCLAVVGSIDQTAAVRAVTRAIPTTMRMEISFGCSGELFALMPKLAVSPNTTPLFVDVPIELLVIFAT